MSGVFKTISSIDKSITPFKAHKSWGYDSIESFINDGNSIELGCKPDWKFNRNGIVNLTSDNTVSYDPSSKLLNTENYTGRRTEIVWYSANKLLSKDSSNPFATYGNLSNKEIELSDRLLAFSIPAPKTGEGIKPGTFELKYTVVDNYDYPIHLKDDGKGNLIDMDLPNPISNEELYVSFDYLCKEKNWLTPSHIIGNDPEVSEQEDLLKLNLGIQNSLQIKYRSKNQSISVSAENLQVFNEVHSNQLFAYMSGSSMNISNFDNSIFNRSSVYSVGMELHPYSSSVKNILFDKQSVKSGIDNFSSQTPLSIYSTGSMLFAEISDGSNTCTCSCSLSIGDYSFILAVKSGNSLFLIKNGTLQSSVDISSLGNTNNDNDIVIGKDYVGGINNLIILSKEPSVDEIQKLHSLQDDSLLDNTNIAGYVLYEQGLVYITNCRKFKYLQAFYPSYNGEGSFYPIYKGLPNTGAGSLQDFYIHWASTVTLYEHEYTCKLDEGEFNLTMNPSARVDFTSDVPSDIMKNENFYPYITTVGLYNDSGQLLAIGKLSSPIKKRNDVDLNIIVRFDI